MSEPDPIAPDAAEKPVMLEDVVTALQKTFSRVSSITQKNVLAHPDSPTSRLGRLIEFDATVRVSPHDGDYLRVAADGAIDLRFKGQIQNDIQYVQEDPQEQETLSKSPNDAQ